MTISRIRGSNSLLEHDDILRCVSDANPSPEYTWLEANTGEHLDAGQQLTFDVCRHVSCSGQCSDSNVTITVQCVATVSAGQLWTSSHNATAAYHVDLRSYNHTCGTIPSRLSQNENCNAVTLNSSAIVFEESPCPQGSSGTNFQVLVLVLVLGSSSPRKFSRIE